MTDRGKFTTIMGNEKISFEQLNDPQWRRAQLMSYKPTAAWQAFFELNGLINVSRLAKDYLHCSQSWLSQRINNTVSHGKMAEFSPEDADRVAAAFRQIADRLNAYAAEIEAAGID